MHIDFPLHLHSTMVININYFSTFLHLLPLLILSAGIHTAKSDVLRSYIVHVHPSKATVTSSDLQGYYSSFLPAATIDTSGLSPILHMYQHVVSGFSARLTEQDVTSMAANPGFLNAYPDTFTSLLTTNTPNFLGLNANRGLWKQSNLGEGVIIGVLDTGLHPFHPSFRATGMPPPPAKWKGKCDFNASLCNNKLIGARTFVSGASAMKGNNDTVSASPFDLEGHGTHTASTAAGSPVPGAQVMGNANGTAIGMAPKAHIAMYKVCAEDGCALSDILAAMDAAVEDGVDVLSLSIGGGSLPFFNDPIAIGAFGAIQKGVFVSCSAGNGGPNSSSLSNEAPWILTVAASTMDRSIRTTVVLDNGLQFDGESLFQLRPTATPPSFFPLVHSGFCGNGSLDGVDVRSKIVLCDRGGDIARVEKGETVRQAGGAGMILANGAADAYSTLADAHVLPSSHISFASGSKIKAYINSTRNPNAAIISKGTLVGVHPAPAIASFSSRGPSAASPGILKPDITGPGVSVLAAWPFPVDDQLYTTSANFNVISGTSMSCPHLSGIAALIKATHPDWSPAVIKSAIMTTADVVDNTGMPILDEKLVAADLFAVGAGHVNPERATDPGLVYDISPNDYIPYLCGLGYSSNQVSSIVSSVVDCQKVRKIAEGELNYPSITAVVGGGGTSVTVGRTVKNVGAAGSLYWVHVEAPAGVSVVVSPKTLVFSRVNQELRFYVTITMDGDGPASASSDGYLSWVSSKYTVRSPISVIFNK